MGSSREGCCYRSENIFQLIYFSLIQVMRHPDHIAGGNRVLLWAHHETVVVIDQKTSFNLSIFLSYSGDETS